MITRFNSSDCNDGHPIERIAPGPVLMTICMLPYTK